MADDFDVTMVPGRGPADRDGSGVSVELCVEGADPLPVDDGSLLVVGRGNEALLVLDDPSVSRNHCLFTRRGAQVTLRDLGSGGGTWVNGQQVQETEVRDGDEVTVGPFAIVVRIAGGDLFAGELHATGAGLPTFSEVLGAEDEAAALAAKLSPPAAPAGPVKGASSPQAAPRAEPPSRRPPPARPRPLRGGRIQPAMPAARAMRPAPGQEDPSTHRWRSDGGRPRARARPRARPRPRPRPRARPGRPQRPPAVRGLILCSTELGKTPLRPGGVVVIGRHEECQVRIDSHDVSRRHAEVRWADGAPVIADLGSLNGIAVNGERVEKASLRPGDEVVVGHVYFWVEEG
jgi:ABC transport system ATP-binding/permease protein